LASKVSKKGIGVLASPKVAAAAGERKRRRYLVSRARSAFQ
jgi:hypothetical protein